MKRKCVHIYAVIGIAIFAYLCAKSIVIAQGQINPPIANPDIAEIFSNAPPPPPGFATPMDYVKSFTKEKGLIDAYHAGKISESEAEFGIELLDKSLKNKASMDTYGKVVDQDGLPVNGADVHGIVGLGFGDTEKHDTVTDTQGLFHFLGLHGQGMTMEIEKKGYYFDYMLPSAHRPNNYLPDPNRPLVFTVWKLNGPEPLEHRQIYSDVPCDGSVKRFDLLSNVQRNSGDLAVALTRSPLKLNQGNRYKPFEWSVTMAITNGGLQETTNIYPYEAPEEGYLPEITLKFPTNMVAWQYEFKRTYFFKDQNGQVYGRMILHIDATRPEPPTYLDADI
jgi:hypothetical protein